MDLSKIPVLSFCLTMDYTGKKVIEFIRNKQLQNDGLEKRGNIRPIRTWCVDVSQRKAENISLVESQKGIRCVIKELMAFWLSADHIKQNKC